MNDMTKRISVQTYQRINGAGFSNSGRRKSRRKPYYLLGLLLAIFVLACGYAYYICTRPIGRHKESVYLLINPKTDGAKLREQIHTKIYPLRPKVLDLYWKYYGIDSNIRTGRYEVPVGVTAGELMKILTQGDQALISLPLAGIRTESELISTLDKYLMADSAELISAWSDSTRYAALGLDRESARSLLFAESYALPWDISPSALMDSVLVRYDAFWTTERKAQAEALGLTPSSVATLASIVESESAKLDEYPRISGLYINRLRKKMPLQSDPTVKFALGDFSLRRVLREHLSTASPYNTYYVSGLPPGPIRLPKRSTLEAVLQSESHDYLYMCAKEDFSGYHRFASDYGEHLRNARLYQRELDKRGIK